MEKGVLLVVVQVSLVNVAARKNLVTYYEQTLDLSMLLGVTSLVKYIPS